MDTRRSKRTVRRSAKMQRGQILIIAVFAITALVAFVGLVVDTGLVFISYGTLRRAVDAGALAAAAQYRKSSDPSQLKLAAQEFLVLNNVQDGNMLIHVCNSAYPLYHDPTLCTTPQLRRLVRVDATSQVQLAFLPVIGIRTITLNATATSEAASLDIVLALDTSESMTWENDPSNLLRDPSECNAVKACDPFTHIQAAAKTFVENLFPADGSNKYDRVSIIPFSRTVADDGSGYDNVLHLDANEGLTPTAYRQKILDAISALDVYQASGQLQVGPNGDGSCLLGTTTHANCRYYIPTDQLQSSNCNYDPVLGYDFTKTQCFTPVLPDSPSYNYPEYLSDPARGIFKDPVDWSKHYLSAFQQFNCDTNNMADRSYCGTSNIGGAFYAAGQEFVGKLGGGSNPHPKSFRQESLWVLILLTDGVANHSNGNLYCPNGESQNRYWCQDYGPGAVSTRHCQPAGDAVYGSIPALATTLFNACNQAPPNGGGGVVNSSLYDADDYARDMADFVALGQQALVFTIGYDDSGLLGHKSPGNDYGEQLLTYAADIGDDGKINTSGLNPDYYYTDTPASLNSIFDSITNQIATRLSQ